MSKDSKLDQANGYVDLLKAAVDAFRTAEVAVGQIERAVNRTLASWWIETYAITFRWRFFGDWRIGPDEPAIASPAFAHGIERARLIGSRVAVADRFFDCGTLFPGGDVRIDLREMRICFFDEASEDQDQMQRRRNHAIRFAKENGLDLVDVT